MATRTLEDRVFAIKQVFTFKKILAGSLENSWTVYGRSVNCLWTVYGQSMDDLLMIHEQSMDDLWNLYGCSMDFLWTVYGRFMDCPLPGNSLGRIAGGRGSGSLGLLPPRGFTLIEKS